MSSDRIIHVGVIAPALMLPKGTVGREEELQRIRESRGLLKGLGRAIGKEWPGYQSELLLGGGGGLQSACREGFFELGGRGTTEYLMSGHDVPSSDNAYVRARIQTKSHKTDLDNYLQLIGDSDVVIFAGGFWRAIAACMMTIERSVPLGILLGVGSAPQVLADLLMEIAPMSVKKNLYVSGDPDELVDHTTCIAWAEGLRV